MAPQLTLYLFLSPACPLSQRYAPEIDRLKAAYSARIRLLETQDPTLARKLGAQVTPEAVLARASGEILYRGRIDDRAISLTKTRPAPIRRDLQIALDEALANRSISVPRTQAIGCSISFPTVLSRGPTWSRDVAPIVFKHCVECHRQGGTGPFSLERYEEAAPLAGTIAAVTSRRLMPPWHAGPNPMHPFQGARILGAGEIDVLHRWSLAGAPPGNLFAAPDAPPFRDGWRLGDPHMVLRGSEVAIPAEGPDQYQCFVVPTGLTESRWVRAFDFRPGNPKVLHHALLFIDATGAARRRDRETPEPGYRCFGLPGFLPTASLGGWTPGMTPAPYPRDGAVRIPRGADLVLQLHYHPAGRPESDLSEVGLYFTEQAPSRPMMDVALGTRRIDIPAGQARYIVRDHFTLPIAVEVTGIIPHAHYICREMRGWAELPSGKRVELLAIRDWDFNWQQHYRYRDPFVLPTDTRLEMEFVYDNSPANPKNPSSPPRRVLWGPEATDEMAGLHVQVMPVRKEDSTELGQALWGKLVRELGIGLPQPIRP